MVSTETLAEIDTSNFEVVHREAFVMDEAQPAMTLDYSGKGSVTFNEGCLYVIGNPEYVLLLINTEEKKFVLKRWRKLRRREKAPRGYKVETDGKGAFVQEDCMLFLDKLAELMDWKTDSYSRFRFYGMETGDKDMILFNLEDAVMFTKETDGTVETAAS